MPASDFRWAKRLAGLSVCLWLLGTATNTALLAYPAHWQVQEGRRVATQSLGPSYGRCRILLVGSSPVVFGLSAKDLQAATGCRAVNLAALSVAHVLNDHLENVLDLARPGDVVVLSDRLWTQLNAEPPPCEGSVKLRCLRQWFRLVPNLNEAIARLRGHSVRRDANGDLLDFPDLPPDPSRPLDGPVDNLAFRLDRISSQVQIIRSRGALPLLAPTPALVRPEARSLVERDLSRLATLVDARVGPGVWLTPVVNTDARSTTLDGQHASAAGRRQWTAQVAAALGGLVLR